MKSLASVCFLFIATVLYLAGYFDSSKPSLNEIVAAQGDPASESPTSNRAPAALTRALTEATGKVQASSNTVDEKCKEGSAPSVENIQSLIPKQPEVAAALIEGAFRADRALPFEQQMKLLSLLQQFPAGSEASARASMEILRAKLSESDPLNGEEKAQAGVLALSVYLSAQTNHAAAWQSTQDVLFKAQDPALRKALAAQAAQSRPEFTRLLTDF